MEKPIKHLKQWWRVPLSLFFSLFGAILGVCASTSNFANSEYTKVVSSVALSKPYYRVRLLFYDAPCFVKA